MQQVAEALKRKKPAPRLDLARRGITVADVDAIRRQIKPCWNLPAGAREAHDCNHVLLMQTKCLLFPVRSALKSSLDERIA